MMPHSYESTSRRLDGTCAIHYHEAGVGPNLVLLHGSGPGVSGWSNFKGNLGVFADHFRTVVPDMPGFGRSDRPAFDRAYPRLAADHLVRLLDALSIERSHLLGNSMGGYVALEFALAHPDRVDRIVGMGPGGMAANILGPDQSEGVRRMWEFMCSPSKAAMERWIDTMVANRDVVDDQLIEERLTGALSPGQLDIAKDIVRSLSRYPETVPLYARVQNIHAPTLITWGRDDRMLPLESGLFGFRQLPNAELHIFSNCGHWAQVERKAEFERVVIEFLTR